LRCLDETGRYLCCSVRRADDARRPGDHAPRFGGNPGATCARWCAHKRETRAMRAANELLTIHARLTGDAGFKA
jgi:hypothetical protein